MTRSPLRTLYLFLGTTFEKQHGNGLAPVRGAVFVLYTFETDRDVVSLNRIMYTWAKPHFYPPNTTSKPMNRSLATLMLGTLLIFAISGCAPSPNERAVSELEEAAENLEDAVGEGADDFADAMGAFGEALSGATGDGEEYEPVERQALAGVIPESMGGMDRTNIESAREGAMGFTVTHAEADFQGGEGTFTLKVTDLAGVPMVGMLSGWALAEVDRESDTEIERTFDYQGNRAHEQYNSESNSGEMSVLVEGFHVEGSGNNMSRDQIHDAMDDAPIDELKRLR